MGSVQRPHAGLCKGRLPRRLEAKQSLGAEAYLNAERRGEQDTSENLQMIQQSVRRKQDLYWVTDGGYGFPAE